MWLIIFCFAFFIHSTVISTPSSLCFRASGAVLSGQQLCTDGEVQLLGTYVQIGIHNVGSLGTSNVLNKTYYSNQLGLIADYDKNGFASLPAPGYSGDFFISGLPTEGIFM